MKEFTSKETIVYLKSFETFRSWFSNSSWRALPKKHHGYKYYTWEKALCQAMTPIMTTLPQFCLDIKGTVLVKSAANTHTRKM